MTNADHKTAIRERMASTGENYTTARRAIEQGRAAEADPADAIIAALRLARERVVADSIEGKDAGRARLDRAIRSMLVHKDTGQGGPSAAALRELLGDPDDAEIRHALESYAEQSER